MPSHPRSGSARTPRHDVSRRSDLRKRGQPSPTSLTPNEAEERGAAWHPHYDYQGDFLLATKYTIPPQHAYTIGCPRLLDQLDQGLAHKLTLVIAPAGYGKTSLLSSWAASLKADCPPTWTNDTNPVHVGGRSAGRPSGATLVAGKTSPVHVGGRSAGRPSGATSVAGKTALGLTSA